MQRHVVRAGDTGGPEALSVEQMPVEDLVGGQVRVSVSFAGVNFWDVMQRRGDVPLPADRVPGVEGTGTVIAVGEGVPASLVGQRVAWSRVQSSYSDIVQGPQGSFLPVPGELSDEVAAGCLMQGITAQYLATSTTHLEAGQSAVVTACAGGVGRLLTQFLQMRGVRVIGVVGDRSKLVGSRADDTVVSPSAPSSAVRDLVPTGVDAVFDASGDAIPPLLQMLRPRGICVIYGSASGDVQSVPLAALSSGSFYLTRTAGRDYAAAPDEWRTRADAVMTAVSSGQLRVDITEVVPLSEARSVHERMEGRRTAGKVILRTRD